MQEHDFGLLSTLVLSLVAAFAGGLAARIARLPPLIGYLAAGILIGPFTPGLVVNQEITNELADIGVALLLFNIGMHFSFKDLLSVRRIAVPGALVQVGLTSLAGASLARLLLTAPWPTCAVIGLALASASTAISTRILEEKRQMNGLAGRVALGWMVVQDMIVILALVLLPALKTDGTAFSKTLLTSLGQTLFQVTGFVVVMVFGGRRLIPALLGYVARNGSRELFTLAVVVMALGIAYGAASIFGVSLALGAFFAGVVIGESDLNHHAAAESLSMQQIFTILFFVSIGMLFNPTSLTHMPLEIAAFLAVVLLGTGALSFLLLLRLRVPLHAAALVGATFAQIGEFSFVLSAMGFTTGLFGARERDLIIAVALVSIVLNPLIVAGATRLARWATEAGFLPPAETEGAAAEATLDHAILIGYGRVGSIVGKALRQLGLPFVIIESDRALTEALRREGLPVIYGDASREAVLNAAKPETARLLIATLPDSFSIRQVVRCVKRIAPTLLTIVRTHADDETRLMKRLGATRVVMGEREIAFGIADYALQEMGADSEKTRETLTHLRQENDAPDPT